MNKFAALKGFLFTAGLFLILWMVCEAAYGQDKPPKLSLPVPESPYSSAIIIDQCAQVVAVIYVDKAGGLHPMHWQDIPNRQGVEAQIFHDIPSHATLEVTVECPSGQAT